MKDAWKNLFFYLLFLLIIVSLLAPLFGNQPKVQELSFTDFLNQVDQGKDQGSVRRRGYFHRQIRVGRTVQDPRPQLPRPRPDSEEQRHQYQSGSAVRFRMVLEPLGTACASAPFLRGALVAAHETGIRAPQARRFPSESPGQNRSRIIQK